MKSKAYVIDTNALIFDPEVIYRAAKIGDTVVIPTSVIRELDSLKCSENKFEARASRDVARELDRLGSYLDLAKGGQLKTGTVLKVYTGFEGIKALSDDVDNRVIGSALKLKKEFKYVAVVSRDKDMRRAARAHGLKAKNYPFELTRLDKTNAPVTPAPVKPTAARKTEKEGFFIRLFVAVWTALFNIRKGLRLSKGR